MFTILEILAAILIFGIIILVHELGHFLMCKWMGVRVNEFAIGMGPKLLSFGKKETKYTLRLLPIGGFCAMEGEDEDAPTPRALGGNGGETAAEEAAEEPAAGEEGEPELPAAPDPRAFPNKKVWRRILIVVAGAVMNLLLGFVLLVAYFGIFTVPDASGSARFSSTIVAAFFDDAISNGEGGLKVGDQILKINGKSTVTDTDVAMLMQSDEDGIMDILVKRDGEKVLLEDVTFKLQPSESDPSRNVLIYDFKVLGIEKTPWTTLVQAAKTEYSVATMIWRSLGDIVTGKYGLNDLSGPVGTVDFIGDAVGQANTAEGMKTLLMLVTMITVNVGIFNLLPLPALDGGRLMFLIFEGIFRRPVPAKYEGMVHFIGLILLMLLMVAVTFTDIRRLIGF